MCNYSESPRKFNIRNILKSHSKPRTHAWHTKYVPRQRRSLGKYNSRNWFFRTTYVTFNVKIQMVLGHDIILNARFISVWESIRQGKKTLIDKNNQLENKNCNTHTYRIWDKILVHNREANEYE